MCVSTPSYVVPLCSRHDPMDLRSYYPGPLLPSSLASQDYMVWYLRCVAAQPFLNVWYGFSYNLGSVFYAPFFYPRFLYLMEHLVYLV